MTNDRRTISTSSNAEPACGEIRHRHSPFGIRTRTCLGHIARMQRASVRLGKASCPSAFWPFHILLYMQNPYSSADSFAVIFPLTQEKGAVRLQVPPANASPAREARVDTFLRTRWPLSRNNSNLFGRSVFRNAYCTENRAKIIDSCPYSDFACVEHRTSLAESLPPRSTGNLGSVRFKDTAASTSKTHHQGKIVCMRPRKAPSTFSLIIIRCRNPRRTGMLLAIRALKKNMLRVHFRNV